VKEFFYFGRWDEDPKGDRAFQAWKLVADDLRAGRKPVMVERVHDGVTCLEIADRFTSYAQGRYRLGEIGVREFGDIRLACMVHFLDGAGEKTTGTELDQPRIIDGRADPVTPLQKVREHLRGRMGVYAFHRNLSKIRHMLKWAHSQGLMVKDLHQHQSLERLSMRLVRREVRLREAEYGVPIYSKSECLRLVGAAADHGGPLLAAVLLGLNGGCDAAWLSEVPISAIDLETGFVDWVRPKTEELCRFPLWPLTAEAIRQWLPRRPAPKDKQHAGRVFLTVHGNLLVREVVHINEDGSIGDINPDDALGKQFAKVEKRAGIAHRRGRLFKALRRSHATAANTITDRDARRMVMGHGFEGMDPHYVRGLFPAERLRRVTDEVGRALLGCVELACEWPNQTAN
jgi:hypothetical protein